MQIRFRIAQNLTTTAPLKTLLTLKKLSQPWCDSYEYDSDDYWKCYIEHKTNPENHQVGTCKMGPSSDRKLLYSIVQLAGKLI